MIDVRIDCDDGHFKFRVAGVLKNGDKYLFVKMNDNKFYCLPGGHVELGESTEDAVLREMSEELGFPVKITRFLGEAQNFYIGKDGKTWHELGFYYVVEAENEADVNKEDYIRIENDKGFMQHLEFKWMTQNKAKHETMRPEFLMELLSSDEPKHIVCDYRK